MSYFVFLLLVIYMKETKPLETDRCKSKKAASNINCFLY